MNKEVLRQIVESAKVSKNQEVRDQYNLIVNNYQKSGHLKSLMRKFNADYKEEDVIFYAVDKKLFGFNEAFVFTDTTYYSYYYPGDSNTIHETKYNYDEIKCIYPKSEKRFVIYNGTKKLYLKKNLGHILQLYLLHEIVHPENKGNHTTFINTDSIYYGQMQGIKMHGKGKYVWDESHYYEGDFVDDEFHGQGTYVLGDDFKYVGEMNHDKMTGKGILYRNNGEWYKGNFIDGKPTGGIYHTYINGIYRDFEGYFKDYNLNGNGYEIVDGKKVEVTLENNEVISSKGPVYTRYNDKTIYADIVSSKPNGRGKIIYDNGIIEEGRIYDGVIEYGWGALTKDGVRTIGKFERGKCTPYPTYTDDIQEEYSYYGEMVNGKYEGEGNLLYNDGKYYEGQFKNGYMHGKGYYSFEKDGYHYTYEGDFYNDKMTGIGTLQVDDSSIIYSGAFHDGKLNGLGCCIYHYQEDSYDEVLFKDGKIVDGEGYQHHKGETYKVIFKDGEIYNSNHSVFLQYEYDVKYEGMILDGKPHGKGVYEDFFDGRYEGNFKDGKKHGKGVFYEYDILEDDVLDTIIGTWENDKLSGKAIIQKKDGSRIECSFFQGKKNGKAILIDAKGIRKEGKYKNDVFTEDPSFDRISFHGQTMYGHNLGRAYCGKGRLENADGSWYEGDFFLEKKHGKGEMHWPTTGTYYIGDFEKNRMTGRGEFYFSDGAHYKGQVKNDVFHGYGTYTYADGEKKEGRWDNGTFMDSSVKLVFGDTYSIETDTYSYTGCIQDGKPHGQGEITWKNGRFYIGSFDHGNITGDGRCLYENGDVYVGSFVDGIRQGDGTLYRYPKVEEVFIKNDYCDLQDTMFLYSICGRWENDQIVGYALISIDKLKNYGITFENGWPVSGEEDHIIIEDDSYFVGKIQDGNKVYKGVTIYKNGDCFVCEYNDGIIEGEAKRYYANNDALKYYYVDGENVDGEDVDGSIYVCRDGRVFEVDVIDGKLEGTGFYSYGYEKNIYVEFKNGEIYFSDGKVIIKKDGYTYHGAFKDGKYSGKGKLITPEGDIIRGTFVEGLLQGEGTITQKNGHLIVGTFVDDFFQGTGFKIFDDKCLAIGFYEDNNYSYSPIEYLKNEQGKCTVQTDEYTYYGEIRKHMFHGTGSIYWSSGDHYEGDFAYGEIIGKGTYYYANGDVFEGTFVRGKKHGSGSFSKYPYKDGKIRLYTILGNWIDDVLEGMCVIRFENRPDYYLKAYNGWFVEDYRCYQEKDSYYIGEISLRKPNGEGIVLYKNGDCYVGNFNYGIKNGSGVYYDSNNVMRIVSYHNGELDNDITYQYPDGRILQGMLKNGKLEGIGTYEYNGQKVIAIFENGEIYHSSGPVIVKKDGLTYQGVIKDGVYDGLGFIDNNEYLIEATFVDGKQKGKAYRFLDKVKVSGMYQDGKFYPDEDE